MNGQSSASGRALEILHFEDNPTDSLTIQSHIENSAMKARITVVDRLATGLTLLRDSRFDVAILDLGLPDDGGLHALDRLLHAAPLLPIVVISGGLDDILIREIKNRSVEYLDKREALTGKILNRINCAVFRKQIEADRAMQKTGGMSELPGETRVRAVLEANIDAVVVVDGSGMIRYANQAAEKMFSRKAGEMFSGPFGLPLVSDGGPIELDIVRQSGEPGVAEMRVVDIEWENVPAYLASLRDITDRKQMEEAMIRTEKLQALGTLAGGIAHDFNNILLAVSGNAKLALNDLSKGHPAYASVVEIAKAGSRATALTKKILSFSRLEETQRQSIQVQSIVDEAVSLLRATLPSRIEIRKDFPDSLPSICADSSQVHQIIMNLATNAVDAMGDRHGILEISAAPVHLNGDGSGLTSKLVAGGYVKLSFKDTGPGIEKKTLSRIFEPFFTTKSQGRGTGMGLAIVEGIMKSHLGEITVYSEVGKGTVFHLYFPVTDEALAEIVPAVNVHDGHGQHILYVDDEEPLVLLVTRALKRLGYEVTGFTDAVKALKAFRERPSEFMAVVTDLSMPTMSGVELAEEVIRIRPDVPVIVTTGYFRLQDQELAVRAGVRELILKPDTIEDLGEALHRQLGETDDIARAVGKGN